MPKMVALDQYPVPLSFSADPCFVPVLLLALASRNTQLKDLNYIPTSWSRAKVPTLVTFLNLAIICGV